MKSRNKAKFKTTLREQGYVIVSETVTFDSAVYCDGKVVNNTEGLWQLQDLNNGSMVVYVDTIGRLPLAPKLDAVERKLGIGVIYMLVKDAVNEQTIKASIESTKQHNINFLPVVILSHIRMNQQTHAVNASKEKLQRTMNNIRSHPDYENKLAELEEFLILLRIVTTAYLHRLTLTMM